MKPEEITKESLVDIDIESIALDRNRLGGLRFDTAASFLEKLKDLFTEMVELGYERNLLEDEINAVNKRRDQLIEYLRRIMRFDPGANANDTKVSHDQLEQEIKNFYNSTTREFRDKLIYLRGEAARLSQDTAELERRQKAAVQAEQRYTGLADQLEKRLSDFSKQEIELAKKKEQVETGHAKLAAVRLAKHFDSEIEKYNPLTEKWFNIAIVSYTIAIVIVGVVYRAHIIANDWTRITWQEGVSKIILFAVLWFGISFIIRNYNINSQLVAVNRHRAAVARTLEDFLASNPQQKNEMIKAATNAMFKHVPIGFISKNEKEVSSPIHEIINTIIEQKKSS